MGQAEVLHGWPIGLTIAVCLGCGVLLARSTSWWIADAAHLRRVEASPGFRPVWLLVLGGLIAVAALLLFPSSENPALDAANPADLILLSLCLGTAAAATPFLAVVDILIHRLPDRIVYPLIAFQLICFVLGQAFGASRIWTFGLIAGIGASLLFGLLHLLGRILHVQTMGLGDVKLAFVVFGIAGLFSPWAPALVLITTMLIAGVWALIAAAAKRRLKGITIAFGPAMLSGMWLGSVLTRFLL